MKKILVGINIFLFAFLLYIIFLITYPYKTIEFENKVFPVKDKIIERGEPLIYTVKYCKYKDSEATVSKSFVNEFVYSTAPIVTNRKVGCRTQDVVVKIPDELPSGDYYLSIKYTYKVNFLRSITTVHTTERFIIR